MNQLHAKVAQFIGNIDSVLALTDALSNEYSAELVCAAVHDLRELELLAQNSVLAWRSADVASTTPSLLGLLDFNVSVVEVPTSLQPGHFFVAIPSREPTGSTTPIALTATFGRAGAACGFSRCEGLMACLGEAAELMSTCFRGDESLFFAKYDEVREHAIHPESILLFSESQYAGHDPVIGRSPDTVPAEFDEFATVAWVRGESIIDAEPVLIPAAYVYLDFPSRGGLESYCLADSNGCAAAATYEDASVKAFFELIERDATALWWYGRYQRPGIDIDRLESQVLMDVYTTLQSMDRSLHLLDLSADFPVRVTAAVSADQSGEHVLLGFGAHFSLERAIWASVREVLQLSLGAQLVGASKHTKSPLSNWNKHVSFSRQPQLLADGEAPTTCRRESPTESPDKMLERCREAFGSKHLAAYVVDVSRPDIGISCVRAVVPGLRHYRRRLAPGRLYTVPRELGWTSVLQEEHQLNPVTISI